jgi:hypothetical protein
MKIIILEMGIIRDIITTTKIIGISSVLNMKEPLRNRNITKKSMIAISLNEAGNINKKKRKEIIKDTEKIRWLTIGSLKINLTERTDSTGQMGSPDIIFGIQIMIICRTIIWMIGKNGRKLLIPKHQEI